MKQRIVTFEELIAPLSNGKVMVVVECLSIDGCEQPDIMGEVSAILNLRFSNDYDDWEDFLDCGFVVMEGDCKPEFITEASLLIDYLRNEKFQAVIQADLFVDGVHQDSSWSGEPEAWNKQDAVSKPAKSVVIRFPVEKTKRHKDSE